MSPAKKEVRGSTPSEGPARSRIELNISSDPANLAEVRRAIESFCTGHGFSEKAVGEIGLCVNEALANVTRHAYEGATDKPVRLVATVENDLATITIRDWGNGIDPSLQPVKAKDPNVPGGLGLICLREMLDSAEFEPQRDGMLLTMTRTRTRV